MKVKVPLNLNKHCISEMYCIMIMIISLPLCTMALPGIGVWTSTLTVAWAVTLVTCLDGGGVDVAEFGGVFWK